MKLLYGIVSVLWSRVARNIYLWIVMLYIVLNNNPSAYSYPSIVYYKCIAVTTAIIIALTYVNNLYLIPAYWAKKKRAQYFLYTTISITFWALVFILAVKTMLSHYPKLLIYHISFLSTVVSDKWSVMEILSEVWILYFGFGLWTMLMTMAWYMNDYAKQQKRLDMAEKKQMETELHFLKNQINPHFLFNTLNNLYGLALKKADNAPDAILRLSSILRYVLYESDTDKVPVTKEIEVMRAYIELEKLRITDLNNVDFRITTDNDLYQLPPLLWMPILENFFKHGIRTADSNIKGYFLFDITTDKMTVATSNTNYKLIDITDDNKHGGIGLDNLYKRLELLFPGKYSISKTDTKESYFIKMEIDLV